MPRKPKQKLNSNLLQTPKGTKDILGEEYKYLKHIYSKAEEIASYYGFIPIQTPHIEKEEIFTATLGESSDIIEKQMYTIRTKGKDRLVLRPEGTAPVMRAYIEHGMQALPQPVMMYYKGSFFRHENPQRGRLREFNQFGLEILGSQDEVSDALIIRMLCIMLSDVGIKSHIIHINSIGDKECAPQYKKELISFLRKKANHLCKDCKRRLKINPLRVLDCKETKCKEVIREAPQMINFLCEECRKHFKNLLEYLEIFNLPYILDSFLVRGLDYYSKTVFEIFEESEENEKEKEENEDGRAKIAVAAGGRYDYLGTVLSGKNIPGVGGALGLERIILSLKEKQKNEQEEKIKKIYLIQLGDLAKKKTMILFENLRKANIPAYHSLSKDSLRSQLKSASSLNSNFALIIGQKEALENNVILRNMETGSQDIISINKIAEYLKNL